MKTQNMMANSILYNRLARIARENIYIYIWLAKQYGAMLIQMLLLDTTYHHYYLSFIPSIWASSFFFGYMEDSNSCTLHTQVPAQLIYNLGTAGVCFLDNACMLHKYVCGDESTYIIYTFRTPSSCVESTGTIYLQCSMSL